MIGAARYLNDGHRALQFGGDGSTADGWASRPYQRPAIADEGEPKNMRFCETNRIGFGSIFYGTIDAEGSYNVTAKKMNPVRLAGQTTLRKVGGVSGAIEGGGTTETVAANNSGVSSDSARQAQGDSVRRSKTEQRVRKDSNSADGGFGSLDGVLFDAAIGEEIHDGGEGDEGEGEGDVDPGQGDGDCVDRHGEQVFAADSGVEFHQGIGIAGLGRFEFEHHDGDDDREHAVAEHFQSGGFHHGSGGCLKVAAFAQRKVGDGCSDSTEFFGNGRINSKKIAFTVD
jgi:hypothetical protein